MCYTDTFNLKNLDCMTQLDLCLKVEYVPHLEQERLWFFPGELLSSKVAIAGSGLVHGTLQT